MLSPEAQPAFVQMVKSPEQLFSYPTDSAFRVVSEDSVTLSGAVAQRLKASKGSRWTRISGPRMFEVRHAGLLDRCLCAAGVRHHRPAARGAQNSRPVYETISKAFGEEVQKIGIENLRKQFLRKSGRGLSVLMSGRRRCVCVGDTMATRVAFLRYPYLSILPRTTAIL